MIFRLGKLQPILDEIGVAPDMHLNGPRADSVLWFHRPQEDVDIYFFTNQSDRSLAIDADFRIRDKYPEIWNAVSGEQRSIYHYTKKAAAYSDYFTQVSVLIKILHYLNQSIVNQSNARFPSELIY